MKEIWPQLRERWKGALKRYQYVLLVMAAGVLLMMLPMGPSGGSEEAQGPPEGEGQFDLELFEEKLSQVLSDSQGADVDKRQALWMVEILNESDVFQDLAA